MRRADYRYTYGYPMTDREWHEAKRRLEWCVEDEIHVASELLKDGTLVDKD